MTKNILDTIVEHKRMEVLKRKARKPLDKLMLKPFYKRNGIDPIIFFSKTEANIIAEFKRRSPSKGKISDSVNPIPVVKAYKDGGAVASSILTDRDFFGGSFKDMENVRTFLPDFPLLRKDFIIDSYQVHEAKAYGADIILLISAILGKSTVKALTDLAVSLGLSVLLEVHSAEELDLWNPAITMVGVNNRDLRNFNVDIEQSVRLFPSLPGEALKISESGLKSPEDILRLYNLGFQGFLMGEKFMRTDDPGESLRSFIESLK
jgi:indole-3-glycerol phosphate synthase